MNQYIEATILITILMVGSCVGIVKAAHEADSERAEIIRLKKVALDAYVQGVKDGHASVKCLPSWPAVNVTAAPDK